MEYANMNRSLEPYMEYANMNGSFEYLHTYPCKVYLKN